MLLVAVLALLPDPALAAGLVYADGPGLSTEVSEIPLGEDALPARGPALPVASPAPLVEDPATLDETERAQTASGTCGNSGSNLTWTLYSDGALYIAGSGYMSNYKYSSSPAPWYSHSSSITSVVIGLGVTSIGNDAFRGCASLASVTIPDSVISVGTSAFYGCSSLTDVYIADIAAWCGIDFAYDDYNYIPCTSSPLYYADRLYLNGELVSDLVIPDEVTAIPNYGFNGTGLTDVTIPSSVFSIGIGAFCNCADLTNVSISEGVFSIGDGAFSGCPSLTSVTIPSSVISIGDHAFYGCTDLTEITIPEGVKSIGSGAFEGDTGLTSVTIPSSVTSIGNYAFEGCTALTSVIIPAGVTIIENRTFYGCTSLTSVAISEGVTRIESGGRDYYDHSTYYGAFSGCTNLVSVTIPSTMTTIGAYAFSDCTRLTNATISKGVTNIENYAFYGCTRLSDVTIPEGVTSIGSYAFCNCTGLTKVTIPSTVISIGERAFNSGYYSNGPLASVEFLGNAPATIGENAFPATGLGRFLISYHSGTTGWATPTWNGYYTECVEETLSGISTLNAEDRNSQNILFVLNDSANTATVGDNSTTNNNSGYNGSNGGTAVIPAMVAKDGKTYRVIGINQRAFSGNRLLSTVELGANITTVDPSAFLNCSAFTAFSVNAGNTHYKAVDGILYDPAQFNLYVYPRGKKGESFIVPDSVATVGTSAFSGNQNLKEIVVPDTVESIGRSAFSDCAKLEKITLPYIGGSMESSQGFYYVFDGEDYYHSRNIPESLKTVVITGGTLHSKAFYGCSCLESITLPGNDAEIPAECFYGCSALKMLHFSDMAQAPEAGHLIIPERITAIRGGAFEYCDGIRIVDISSATGIGTQEYRWENGNRQPYWRYVSAFDNCNSLSEYRVAASNPYFCADQWGVLYSKNKTVLCDYPSARKWPYYNVADEAMEISNSAFGTCANLANLYIPTSVTTIANDAITNCPGMTVCAYRDSTAYTYAGNHNIPSWAMDNYRLQNIEIYSLPEQTIVPKGTEDFAGLYVVANGGRALQLDDYTLRYDPNKAGKQEVVIEYQGQTASFPISLYGVRDEIMEFTPEATIGTDILLVAVYDTCGKMLSVETGALVDGKVQVVLPEEIYDKMGQAKLFALNNTTYQPSAIAITREK